MTGRPLTDFEQVLLGTINRAPSTGYDLKLAFANTPMGVYQPSSGALYPALRRLEQRGLLRAEPADPGGRAQTRRRYVYHITGAGEAAHADWVRKPVNPATISADLTLHLMRFVMMESVLPRAEVLAFLADLRDALAAFLDGLEDYAAGTQSEDRHSPLALDHGIATHAASLAWAKRTINALSREPAGPPERVPSCASPPRAHGRHERHPG